MAPVIVIGLFFCLHQDKATSTNDLNCEDNVETPVLFRTPTRNSPREETVSPETSGGSTTSVEIDYEPDPDVPEGVIPQSQPCWKNSIHYHPTWIEEGLP